MPSRPATVSVSFTLGTDGIIVLSPPPFCAINSLLGVSIPATVSFPALVLHCYTYDHQCMHWQPIWSSCQHLQSISSCLAICPAIANSNAGRPGLYAGTSPALAAVSEYEADGCMSLTWIQALNHDPALHCLFTPPVICGFCEHPPDYAWARSGTCHV